MDVVVYLYMITRISTEKTLVKQILYDCKGKFDCKNKTQSKTGSVTSIDVRKPNQWSILYAEKIIISILARVPLSFI